MKKIKLNKVKLALGLLGVIGATSLVAPILVSCGNNTPIEPEKPLTEITAKATNDITIWEYNAIAVDDKKKWTVSLLSKAFNGINKDNIKNIKKIEVSNNIVTISNSIDSIKSNPTTNTSTVLTKTMTDEFFATGGIWASKNNFTEADLKGTTKIDQSAFHSKQLVSVIIPNTITEIGTESFQNNQLTSINIPDSVTSIGNRAFIENNFKTYSDIKITDKVLNSNDGSGTIKDRFKLIFGFDYPRDFEEINAKENNDLTIWELNAINNGYKSISLFSRVFNNIDANSFQSIKTAKVSNGVVSISNNAGTTIESKPTTNTETVLTQELTNIYFAHDGIWAGKTTFVEADLKGTTKIDNFAFFEKKLTSVILPNTLTTIGRMSFPKNELTSIIIPDSVTSIERDAFTINQFKSSNDIEISPELLNSICDWNGKTVRENFELIFGVLYHVVGVIVAKEGNYLLIWELNAIAADKKNWTVPLLSKAFDNVKESNLNTIKNIEVLSDGVVKLTNNLGEVISSRKQAYTTTSLKYRETDEYFATGGIWDGKTIFGEADLKGTTEIDQLAFHGKQLVSVILPNTLTTIGNAFQNNQLTSIKIPDSVTSIGQYAFKNNQFKSSNDITISPKLLNSTCSWNNQTVKENFELIFGVPYTS